jgi:hypothetical protein
MATISEQEFKKLCDDLYLDRANLTILNPGMGEREAALWLLYGSLVSLLDIPSDHQPELPAEGHEDPYFHAIDDLLRERVLPPFDYGAYLRELSERLG